MNKSLKKQMIGVAIAAGVVATFGTPFGGIIFSIEVTATYYMVGSLLKAFICSTLTLIISQLFTKLQIVTLFQKTSYESIELDYEVALFCLLGVCCGYVASIYNLMLTKMVFLRVRLKQPFISNRWRWCFFVGLTIGVISFPVSFMRLGDKRIINEFFSFKPLEESQDAYLWTQPAVLFNLIVYCVLKLMFNILSLSCPIPAGAFAPVFVLGAGVGRLFGYFMKILGL
mmetsp:Transcript_1960/g.1420  ORF Transcript_1960/g.1420 Transcript_1960/m.1420 type:complete len:228 (+) Transcript_1960:669-1352(+)